MEVELKFLVFCFLSLVVVAKAVNMFLDPSRLAHMSHFKLRGNYWLR